ncbi:CDP-glucose 4,6-dehydratase [Paenibacillus larvae subsp. larvae DSM 25430]|nr:CDP-glucose 4,6-dehydratase [Paenibacillus larvae subsp. larvae DSM 25430]MDR5594470.1 CDP-glucose 4,6-dehydratase [Paenibacillus larvae]
MEEMVRHMDREFWKGKKVFITGHTGFKGAWLCLWLYTLGAKPVGYALHPPTNPSLFGLGNLQDIVPTIYADVRDGGRLRQALADADADIVIHMAAQPLVRESYQDPVYTYQTNIMGTVHLLEAVRHLNTKGPTRTKSIINVTTDKCYDNREWIWGYRENDPLGGSDPYSSSKACSELVTAAYRYSYFHPSEYDQHQICLATARAGNVIGGGDWAWDRLIPDCIRSFLQGDKITIRHPQSVRPWQHVLEPLGGYLLLAQRAYEEGPIYAQSWNFGPAYRDAKPVEWVVRCLCDKWGAVGYEVDDQSHPHETAMLKLDCSKAVEQLGWMPRWNLNQALDKVVEWMHAYQKREGVRSICIRQIEQYMAEQV